MKRLGKHETAYSLVELLFVLAIIAILAAILFVALRPARNQSEEARCMSNLRQIGMAIQMYRQDCEGREPDGSALSATELGLPESVTILANGYIKNKAILKCNDEYFPYNAKPFTSYQVTFFSGETPRKPLPPFSKTVAKYGSHIPLFIDPHHGDQLKDTSFDRTKSSPFLVLRLDGSVQEVTKPNHTPYWNW